MRHLQPKGLAVTMVAGTWKHERDHLHVLVVATVDRVNGCSDLSCGPWIYVSPVPLGLGEARQGREAEEEKGSRWGRFEAMDGKGGSVMDRGETQSRAGEREAAVGDRSRGNQRRMAREGGGGRRRQTMVPAGAGIFT